MRSSPAFLILATGLLSALVGGGAGYFAAAGEQPARPAESLATPGDGAALARLGAQVEALGRGVEELRQQVANNQLSERHVASDEQAIEAAVGRWMGEHGGEARALAEEAAAPGAPAEGQGAALAKAFTSLLDPGLGQQERQALWQQYAKAGLVDGLVAEFEARAEGSPSDPSAQVDLGQAYLQKLFTVGAGPEQGLWATKADQAFDKALALDETHWDARFSKAVSLSFWPPVFGKGKEAIANFETLVAQQAKLPRQDRFAQTHLLLGNMYLQLGDKQKALDAWQAGLAQFPGDEALLKQVDLNEGQ